MSVFDYKTFCFVIKIYYRLNNSCLYFIWTMTDNEGCLTHFTFFIYIYNNMYSGSCYHLMLHPTPTPFRHVVLILILLFWLLILIGFACLYIFLFTFLCYSHVWNKALIHSFIYSMFYMFLKKIVKLQIMFGQFDEADFFL